MTSQWLTPGRLGPLTCTPLGLGTARLGAVWQGRGIREGLRCLETAIDLGITLIDTADVYGRGITERMIGRVIRSRSGAAIITKVGLIKPPIGVVGTTRLPRRGHPNRCVDPAYLRRAVHASARRLGRSELDCVLLHEPDADDLSRDDVIATMTDLVARGDARAWGACVQTASAAQAALAAGAQILQIPATQDILPVVARHPRRGQTGVLAFGLQPASGDVLTRMNHALSGGGADGVLLGMSAPERVVQNLSSLQAWAPACPPKSGGHE